MLSAFDSWLISVDEQLISICGIGHMDLPDYHYYDMFQSGYTPHEAASEVINNQMPEFDDDDEITFY